MAIDESTRSVVVETRNSSEPPPDQGADLGITDLFKRIYQFFYSKTVGLIIILAMAVLVLFGVVLPQAPAGVYADPEARAQFVQQQAQRMGGLANVFDFLGFFHMFSSVGFLIVVALLAASIIACTVHRIPQLWQRFRHPRTHVTERFFDLARYRGSFPCERPGPEAMSALRTELRSRHYRVIADDADGETLYADKFAWGGFGTVAAHLSFIVILAAFVISGTGGIDDQAALPVGGDAVEVGHGTGLSVKATSFNATTYDDGRPKDYVAHLVVSRGANVLGEQDVRVNEPLRADGVKFHQNSYGIGAQVQVKDKNGAVIAEELVPLSEVAGDTTHVYGALTLPGGERKIQVVTPASGATSADLAAGEAALQLFQAGSGSPETMGKAAQGESVTLDDLTATFQRESQYTLINVRQDPGAIWMWIGSALLVLGMTVTFTCRHRRIWIRLSDAAPTDAAAADGPGPGGTRMRFASNDKEDLSFERQFTSLVYAMSDALEGQGKDKEKHHA